MGEFGIGLPWRFVLRHPIESVRLWWLITRHAPPSVYRTDDK